MRSFLILFSGIFISRNNNLYCVPAKHFVKELQIVLFHLQFVFAIYNLYFAIWLFISFISNWFFRNIRLRNSVNLISSLRILYFSTCGFCKWISLGPIRFHKHSVLWRYLETATWPAAHSFENQLILCQAW